MAVDRFLKSAGLFSNVDLSGRLSSGFRTTETTKQGNRNVPKRKGSNSRGLLKRGDDPLLQSARVHRKLKTIVPPEPTGEGLPDDIVSLLPESQAEVNIAGPANGGDTDDDVSVQSGRSNPSLSATAEAIINRKKGKTYKYTVFPSKLNSKLFGEPRPLPAAVIAEFDRQRKDAVQIRRKHQHRAGSDASNKPAHIQRAHSTVEAVAPPSPEVATFTVFFMAFTGLVGKELMEMAHTQKESDGRTILSTYVPSGNAVDLPDDVSDAGSRVEEESVDETEKQHVAAMKAARPTGGMFGEDGEEGAPVPESTTNGIENGTDKDKSGEEDKKEAPPSEDVSVADSTKTDSSNFKARFRDNLSDRQVEEAKAKGRAQLGLAFEMLTMMKKRALQADPEAYQCLIDACGRVGDTKRATELLAKMHEDGIVADGTVYACLVSAFSAESAWQDKNQEELPEWANSTAVDMDWNKLTKRSFLDRVISQVVDLEDEEDSGEDENATAMQKLRKRLANRRDPTKSLTKAEDREGMEFFVTETVERQIALGENLLEIVFPDISIDTENEICPRCNFTLSDDDVVAGWSPGQPNDYTTSCPNCTQRFVPHFCVQCSSPTFVGSRGPETPLMCERLSPWVLQKEIRSVMSDVDGTGNLLSPEWREKEYKNAVLWWNLVLSCMRFRLPFSFLLQGSFGQNLIAPMPED